MNPPSKLSLPRGEVIEVTMFDVNGLVDEERTAIHVIDDGTSVGGPFRGSDAMNDATFAVKRDRVGFAPRLVLSDEGTDPFLHRAVTIKLAFECIAFS